MKKVLGQILFISLFCIGINVFSYGQASDLQGTWVLDSLIISKYTEDNLVRLKDNKFLPNSESGAYSTIIFASKNTCKIQVDDNNSAEGSYSLKDNMLSLIFTAVPVDYEVIESAKQLVLYRKFSSFDIDNGKGTASYSLKLFYSKRK